LNPDTTVEKGALQTLSTFLEEQPAAGAVGPGLMRPEGGPDPNAARVSYTLAAALFIDSLRLRSLPLIGPRLYRRLVTPYDYGRTQPVEAVSGAAILARREVLQELDGFGEMFLHCGEDLDLCFHIRKAGWEIWYVPQAVIIHINAQSTKQAVVRTYVNAAISTEIYFNRCYGTRSGRVYRWIVKTVQIPVLIATGAVRFLFRKASAADLYQRWQIARAVMRWRPMR
jgi:GT2 family glycosyltransferase